MESTTVSSSYIVAMGEPMVEFNQTGEKNGRNFLQGFGGDTSNFAVAAARQGARVSYISALGDDPYGAMLRQMWRDEGIDDSCVVINPSAFTAIYFVTHDTDGHHFHFFRKDSAASCIKPNDLPEGVIEQARALHFSGISLAISENARETCWRAVQRAKDSSVWVSFDTNLRRQLWSIDQARVSIQQAISLCDICLPSWDDMTAITGLQDADAIADQCLSWGAKIVALKMGDQGALIVNANERHRIEPVDCQPVDATGAGDTFGGAFIHRLCEGDDLYSAGVYASTAAAISTESYGAVEPIPYTEQVRARIKIK
ncbi:MAG: sugar kinase [Burkholderiaceae bacterium]